MNAATRRRCPVLMAFVALMSVAACQPHSRAEAGEGAVGSAGDSAAQPESPATSVTPGTIVLGSGDEATIAPGSQLHFLRVVNDSRCPKGAQCVWAGEVTIEFELKSPQRTTRFELSSARAPSTTLGALQFELTDYGACPPAGHRPADAECATVTITAATTQ